MTKEKQGQGEDVYCVQRLLVPICFVLSEARSQLAEILRAYLAHRTSSGASLGRGGFSKADSISTQHGDLVTPGKTWEPEPQLWRSKETVSTWGQHALRSPGAKENSVSENPERESEPTCPRLGRINLKVTERRLDSQECCVTDCRDPGMRLFPEEDKKPRQCGSWTRARHP